MAKGKCSAESVMFLHSACCGAHWELVVKADGTYDLQCEKCGQPVRSGVHVTGPNLSGSQCQCGTCLGEGG